MVSLIQSRNIQDYSPVISGLYEDFHSIFHTTVLKWCGIFKDENEEPDTRLWEVWLIKDSEEVIGICGLYSLDEIPNTLWLGWFGILPKHRNKKLGSTVLSLLENNAKLFGASTLNTYVDKNGAPLSFYYRHNFKRICTVGEYVDKNGYDIEEFESREDHVLTKQLL